MPSLLPEVEPEVATLRKGQIIEIVMHDGDCRKTLRRVKIKRITDNGGSTVEIVGVNMQGKNSIDYTLPREPLEAIVRRKNHTGWLPFDDSGEADE